MMHMHEEMAYDYQGHEGMHEQAYDYEGHEGMHEQAYDYEGEGMQHHPQEEMTSPPPPLPEATKGNLNQWMVGSWGEMPKFEMQELHMPDDPTGSGNDMPR